MYQNLPPKANLEHLKKQAKSLLESYHAGEPQALERASQRERFVLADAQWVVAKEYGFPSWARLKTYLEGLSRAPAQRSRPLRIAFIEELSRQLLRWAGEGQLETLGSRLALMPLRDILDVREWLTGRGEGALLVDGLLKGLKHSEPRVRYNCAQALDHLADERCTEPLRALLTDPVPRVRRAALHSLSCDACKLVPLPGRLDLFPTLVQLAQNDPSVRVRRAAVESLAETYDPRAAAVLQQLAQLEPDAGIRQRAARGLT